MALPAGGGANVGDPVDTRSLAPKPEDVHAQIPQRDELWTADSRPTIDEVRRIIASITATLAAEFPTVPVRWAPVATAYITYRAAAQIETSYNPEQQLGDNAPATLLDANAGVEIARLRAGINARLRLPRTVAIAAW